MKDGIVNHAVIYGRNGSGKSNLTIAIFDIIEHLTDKNRDVRPYEHYTNAYNESKIAEFYYKFFINGKEVVYEYRKTDYETLVFERFSIDDRELILFDREKHSSFTSKLEGAETLTKTITDQHLSALKYIKNNSSLVDNDENNTFASFFGFVESMLFFRSLNDRYYLGYASGSRKIDTDIIERGNHQDLERFLNEAGIECKLSIIEKILAFDFGRELIPYHEIASTGTNSLFLFYYWFQRIKDEPVPFLVIDEFDAFYHHDLSALIVSELKKTDIQFILTTHNTSIMTNDLLRPDCYFIMTKDKIESLPNCTEKELREAHNLENMYNANTFNVK